MTREKILDAAARIFSQKGFHATSMQDIASAVNLQKASLYYHVSSKQEILLALSNMALDLVTEKLSEVFNLPLPSDEKLRTAMIAYLQTLADHRGLSAIFIFEHRFLESELRARHIPRRDRFEQLWRGLIQQGVDDGTFACQDVALSTRALLGVMSWTITWYRPDGPMSAVEIADQFAELILTGLMVRDGQHDI